ncbi:MAG: Com family DNA-binding transcriptional regulator [Syntrophomonas sp.]
MRDLRCKNCHRLLGRYLECEKLEIKCPRCGAINIVVSPPESVNCPPLKKQSKVMMRL